MSKLPDNLEETIAELMSDIAYNVYAVHDALIGKVEFDWKSKDDETFTLVVRVAYRTKGELH